MVARDGRRTAAHVVVLRFTRSARHCCAPTDVDADGADGPLHIDCFLQAAGDGAVSPHVRALACWTVNLEHDRATSDPPPARKTCFAVS